MPPPRFSPDLNWGHVLTICTLMGGGLLGYGAHKEAMQALHEKVQVMQTTSVSIQHAVNSLTREQGILDERQRNTMELFSRIDVKLEALDSRIHGISSQIGKQNATTK